MFNIIIFIVFLLYTALVIFKFRGTKFVLVNVISGFFLFVFSLGIVTDLIKVYKVTRTPKLTYAKIIGKFESGDGDGYILEYAGIENKYETSQKYKMNEPVFMYANSERRLSSPFRVTDFHSELNREHHYERIRAQKKI